jgi:hypothetical protein
VVPSARRCKSSATALECEPLAHKGLAKPSAQSNDRIAMVKIEFSYRRGWPSRKAVWIEVGPWIGDTYSRRSSANAAHVVRYLSTLLRQLGPAICELRFQSSLVG